jgi:hypothetical protein
MRTLLWSYLGQRHFLRLTGSTLNSIEYVPSPVLRHLGSQFGVPPPDLATLRALYKRKMTRVAHQSWAIEYGGFRALDTRGEDSKASRNARWAAGASEVRVAASVGAVRASKSINSCRPI